jgi:hypothetical protein
MYFNMAYELKKELSHDFLQPAEKISIFSDVSMTLKGTSMRGNINGIGISEKEDGDYALRVYTGKELSTSAVARYLGINAKDLIVKAIGPISTLHSHQRHRPYQPGLSVGHYNVSAGTLGCLVKTEQGKICILGNNHILADTNRGKSDDCILQPGMGDGGLRVKDRIAGLYTFGEIQEGRRVNRSDWALALVDNPEDIFPAIPDIGSVNGVTKGSQKMKVVKYGRTTGLVDGRITSVSADIKVDYGEFVAIFEDQLEIQGYNPWNGQPVGFASGGDSGALVMEKNSNVAVGLLFCGTQEGTSFANPITEILERNQLIIL